MGVGCLTLPKYSDAFQDEASAQLAPLAPGSPARVLVDDYGTLRKRIQAACPNG